MRNLDELDSGYGLQKNETHEILSEIKEVNSAEQTFRVLVSIIEKIVLGERFRLAKSLRA